MWQPSINQRVQSSQATTPRRAIAIASVTVLSTAQNPLEHDDRQEDSPSSTPRLRNEDGRREEARDAVCRREEAHDEGCRRDEDSNEAGRREEARSEVCRREDDSNEAVRREEARSEGRRREDDSNEGGRREEARSEVCRREDDSNEDGRREEARSEVCRREGDSNEDGRREEARSEDHRGEAPGHQSLGPRAARARPPGDVATGWKHVASDIEVAAPVVTLGSRLARLTAGQSRALPGHRGRASRSSMGLASCYARTVLKRVDTRPPATNVSATRLSAMPSAIDGACSPSPAVPVFAGVGAGSVPP